MDTIKVMMPKRNERRLRREIENYSTESLICKPEVLAQERETICPNDIYKDIRLHEESVSKKFKNRFILNNRIEITKLNHLGPLAFEMIAHNKVVNSINILNRNTKLELIDLTKSFEGLALWDFDGTLGDTEFNQWLAFNQVLKPLGIVVEKNFYATKCRGNNSVTIYERIMKEYGIEFDPKEMERKRDIIISQMEKNNTIPPYEEMIERVKYTNSNNNFILTNNLKENVETILNGWGVRHMFADIISATQLGKNKKEILRNPFKYFGTHKEPNQMVVIEDSLETIRSANNLGIPTIGIFGGMSIDEEIKTLSTVCISV